MRDSSWENQKKRRASVVKALRKQKISKEIYHMDWYNNLHQYSKNKVHCSCGICRFKNKWEPDKKPMQDIRKILDMDNQYKEYIKSA